MKFALLYGISYFNGESVGTLLTLGQEETHQRNDTIR